MVTDKRVINVILTGFGVMMAYAGMLGGAIVMPTIFKDMKGAHGLSESSAFYGLIICNSAVVLSGPFTPSLSRMLGTRTSVIIAVIMCGTINNVLFYPTNYLVYSAFLLNGIGCALLRVAALAYMTKNSTQRNLSRHTTIHWMMFTVGLMLGNGIVMVMNIKTKEINDDKRYAIATAMSVVCLCAIPGYFLTSKIPPDYDQVIAAAHRDEIKEETRRATETTGIISFPQPHESVAAEYTDLLSGQEDTRSQGAVDMVKQMLYALTRPETLQLLGPMFAAGVYCTAYSPIIPTAVGDVSKTPWLISAFGIAVGCGQLSGAFLTGGALDKVGIRKISIVTAALSIITFILTGLVVEMGFSSRWQQWVEFSEALILVLAYFIGVCDMTNNVCLTVAIGRVYRNNSDPAFSLFISVMSVSMVIWYLLATAVTHLYIILALYGVVTILSAVSFSFIKLECNGQ